MLHNCKSFNLVHLPVSNLHQGRAGQFTMTMKILLVCIMYCKYVWSLWFFLSVSIFFLFLHKIIHLRKINDFIPTKICACEKEGRFSRWAQQLTCGKSLSLRHNIVHIWGQPQLLVKLRFIEKKKSQFSHM